LTRPSISASCMTTPMSRAPSSTHSRNSAALRSSSTKRLIESGYAAEWCITCKRVSRIDWLARTV